jgi:hypothetical protein
MEQGAMADTELDDNGLDAGHASELAEMIADLPPADAGDSKEAKFLRYALEQALAALFRIHQDLGGKKTPEEKDMAMCWAFDSASSAIHDIRNRSSDRESRPWSELDRIAEDAFETAWDEMKANKVDANFSFLDRLNYLHSKVEDAERKER